jgi:hypothetical protein
VGFTQCDDARTAALLDVDDPCERKAIEELTHSAWVQARLTRDGGTAEAGSSAGQDA